VGYAGAKTSPQYFSGARLMLGSFWLSCCIQNGLIVPNKKADRAPGSQSRLNPVGLYWSQLLQNRPSQLVLELAPRGTRYPTALYDRAKWSCLFPEEQAEPSSEWHIFLVSYTGINGVKDKDKLIGD